ncbi:MAG: acetoacetate decarboxylase family protein [Thermodesulfobacteriota bacterium]
MGFVKSFQEIIAAIKPTGEFYDAEMLTVFWETRPEIVAMLLPPPLKPAPFPLAMAFVAQYPDTNFGLVYKESALFLRAVYNGEEGSFCLSMPVTDDMAMAAGRELVGLPKKMAEIHFEKDNEYVGGWTKRREVRFMEIKAKLNNSFNTAEAEKILNMTPEKDGALKAVSFLFRYFPQPESDPYDLNPWLMRQETLFRPREMAFGQAEIILRESKNDPWAEVEVVKPLGAVYTRGDNFMGQGQAVAKVDALQFAPYAFIKMDMS